MVSSQVVQVGKELLHVKDETGEIISRALTKGGKLGTLDLQGALDEAIRQRTISGKLDIKVRRLQFLYDPYEPKFWYFELVECARRLTFTAVIGFVSNGSVLQVIVSMLLAIMFVRIYNATSPFVKDSHDSLAEIAQWATFLTMFCALVIKSQENGGVEEENSSWVDLALVVVQTFIPCLLFYQQVLKGKTKNLDSLIGEEEEGGDEEKGGEEEEEEEIVDEEDEEDGEDASMMAELEEKIKNFVEESCEKVKNFMSERLKAAGDAYVARYAKCMKGKGGVSAKKARNKSFEAALKVLQGVSGRENDKELLSKARTSRDKLKLLVRGIIEDFVRDELLATMVKRMQVGGKEMLGRNKIEEKLLGFVLSGGGVDVVFDAAFGTAEEEGEEEEEEEGEDEEEEEEEEDD